MTDWLMRALRSPWQLMRRHRWRVYINRLRARGMRIGRNVVIMPAVRLDSDYPWLIEIADGCRISSYTRIMAHDATAFRDLGVTRLGRVRILRDSFIGEHTIILPGVTIGPRAMVAAGSVVSRDVGEGMLAAGNPARAYGQYDEFLTRTVAAARGAFIVSVHEAGSPEQVAAIGAAFDRGQQVYVRDAEDDLSFYHNITSEELRRAIREAYERTFGATPDA